MSRFSLLLLLFPLVSCERETKSKSARDLGEQKPIELELTRTGTERRHSARSPEDKDSTSAKDAGVSMDIPNFAEMTDAEFEGWGRANDLSEMSSEEVEVWLKTNSIDAYEHYGLEWFRRSLRKNGEEAQFPSGSSPYIGVWGSENSGYTFMDDGSFYFRSGESSGKGEWREHDGEFILLCHHDEEEPDKPFRGEQFAYISSSDQLIVNNYDYDNVYSKRQNDLDNEK